jgi:hypothetical protein
MMPYVTRDDLRGQAWINHFVVHGAIPIQFPPTFIERYPLGCGPGRLRNKETIFR